MKVFLLFAGNGLNNNGNIIVACAGLLIWIIFYLIFNKYLPKWIAFFCLGLTLGASLILAFNKEYPIVGIKFWGCILGYILMILLMGVMGASNKSNKEQGL